MHLKYTARSRFFALLYGLPGTHYTGFSLSSALTRYCFHFFQLRQILLCVGIAFAGFACSSQGEKLATAPGMQIIGGTEDGGGFEHFAGDLLQIMRPGTESDNDTDVVADNGTENDRDTELETHLKLAETPLADEQEDESEAEAESEAEPESSETTIAEAPDASGFGEVHPGAKYEPERTLTESEVASHLAKARQWKFGAYRVYIWRGSDYENEGFALYHRDTLADARSGHFYVTSTRSGNDDFTTVKGPDPGADIDGDGVPDLILYEYSGGMHCCTTVRHIECGERPLLRAEIHTWHSRPAYEDMDGDGRVEVRFVDTSYAYWNECYAASPFPPVVLRIRDGRYEMAEEIMRSKGPSADDIAGQTKKLREWIARYHEAQQPVEPGEEPPEDDDIPDDWPLQTWRSGRVSIPSPVWGVMLKLIYSGRCKEAITFVDEVWPEGKPGKQDFISDVADQVMSSWYGRHLPWIDELRKAIREAQLNMQPQG